MDRLPLRPLALTPHHLDLPLHQLTIFPRPIGRLLARLGHRIDGTLPGRYRGRIARFLGPQPGRYVSPDLRTSEALLMAFAEQGIRYAVIGDVGLSLPGSSEALTVLIDDEDVGSVRRLVTPWPAGEPIEAYSPTGLPGFAFGDMPLMPPRLARQILDGAEQIDGISTANPMDSFFVDLYRLVYLGGPQASLPAESAGTQDIPLASAIAAQAALLGVPLDGPITLDALDALLRTHDWQPPLDMLERIGCWNPWVAEKLRQAGQWVGAEPPGMTVFYLRQRAIDEGKTDLVLNTLRSSGFRLLAAPTLTPQQMADIAAHVRGGNWGRGPFPLSGGDPGAVYIAHDANPLPVDDGMMRQFPLLDNNRIQLVKQRVRDAVHAGLSRPQRYNAMHSTDNSVQAWRAVREMYPAFEADLRAALNDS